MQNDSNVEILQTEISNPEYVLTMEKFEAEYKKYAPEWALEKNADSSYKYHATDSAFKTWLPMNETILKLQHQVYATTTLENDCMIGQVWFMKGTPVSALIKNAEKAYKAEVVAQNSKIEFGTDDNETWWAHDVPFYGTVQMNWIKEDQEWDIFFNECWQGPFQSKSKCIQHLEECIHEQREEQAQGENN